MLTRPKSSVLIEEQERKKKEEIELKSKRKAEREQKLLKAEDRVRRAEAKAKDGTRKRKNQAKTCSDAKKLSFSEDLLISAQGSSSGPSIPIGINENECCVCFCNGLEWVKCACSRWEMHHWNGGKCRRKGTFLPFLCYVFLTSLFIKIISQ